jgi:L-seryl-tRNA(Ser) seleniumtransferase
MTQQELYKKIPAVDKLLTRPDIKQLTKLYNEELVKFCIRRAIEKIRIGIGKKKIVPSEEMAVWEVKNQLETLTGNAFKKVYNATGVVVHTNLGRAPYSPKIIEDASAMLGGYNNLEFDLEKGERGSRHTHLEEKLKYLTGAEDVLIVNNNAAAVMLVLRFFSKGKEAIVSRGELIEIGGSFRIPEIMASSDCLMKEVGATNKTHLRDYENAINENTALLFKAHKSNYVIKGFTEEVSLKEMVALGKKHKIPVVYDMGSGLLQKSSVKVLQGEPDVKQTLAEGIDLVTFSGDKLIGGPQAGVIAGKKEFISKLKKEPMVRALRIGKTTIAFMQAALSYYLDEKKLFEHNRIFEMLNRTPEDINQAANQLKDLFSNAGLKTEVVASDGFCGGGAMPDESLPSFSVKIAKEFISNKEKVAYSEKLFHQLLMQAVPIVSVLKKGEIFFDLLTIDKHDFEKFVNIVMEAEKQILNS